MKKTVSVFLALILLLSCNVISSSAAESNVKFSLFIPNNAEIGEVITVKLSAIRQNITAISAFSGSLVYSTQKLELVGSNVSSRLKIWETNQFNIGDESVDFNFDCAPSRSFHYLTKSVNYLFEMSFRVKESYQQSDILLKIDSLFSPLSNENIPFSISTDGTLYGDTDFDNHVTLSDAVLLFQYVAGKNELPENALKTGDYNIDGVVDLSDAIQIFSIVSGQDERHFESIKTISPSCETEGYTIYTCTCGETFTTDVRAALGHSFTLWQESVSPTPFKKGLAMRKCTRCGLMQTKLLDTRRDEMGNITYYSQRDARWAGVKIGCGNMDRNGCAPTAIAMALCYKGLTIEPLSVAFWLYNNTEEFNRSFHGASGSAIRLAAEHFGATVVKIDSYSSFVEHLNNGAAVVGAMGGGFFCKKGNSHSVFMVGYNGGNVTCYDPYYTDRCGEYNALEVWNQRSSLSVDLRYDNIVFYALY